MKRIIYTIIALLLCGSICYGAEYEKVINKDIHIVKVMDECEFVPESETATIHIQVKKSDDIKNGNEISYWIESNGKIYNKTELHDVKLIYKYDHTGIYQTYTIIDDIYEYLWMGYMNDNTWSVSFSLTERIGY